MPLTELMNYFNDQIKSQTRQKHLPNAGFFKVNDQYWARFGNLLLRSELTPMHYLLTDESLGHYAQLSVRSSAGNPLSIDSIVANLEDSAQVIFLDRLVRTLHSLNYLHQHDGANGLLALQVQQRHILSVANDHGRTFERILGDCGLGADRIILHTRVPTPDAMPHFLQAFASYRQRGYRLAVSVENTDELNKASNGALPNDFIFVSPLTAAGLHPKANARFNSPLLVASAHYAEPAPGYQKNEQASPDIYTCQR